MGLDQKEIKTALAKVIKKGIAFDVEYYNRNWLTQQCVKKINENLLFEGYSAELVGQTSIDIYYIQSKDKITTIEIGAKGIEFDKSLKASWAAAISPVVRIMMETLSELTEN